MQPKISVIVPVYKAEKYLHRCIDSILAQTFTDFELILVNDGSPDNSGAICDGYAAKDNRVRVFHKKNGGVSSARQFGLDQAQGEYIIHADSDDWVEADMFEELHKQAKEKHADMVICDYYVNYSGHQELSKQKPSALDHETVLKELFISLNSSCWNKLVKRACINKYSVKFPKELSFMEDGYFNAAVLKNPIKVSYLPKAFYHYVLGTNENSICDSFNSKGNYSVDAYNYDRMLYEKFTTLLKVTSAYDTAEAFIGYNLVIRAFNGGIFSSKDFKNRCKKFKKCVWKKSNSIYFVSILLISCMGGYSLMYKLHTFLKKAQKSFKSTKRSISHIRMGKD